MFYILEENLNFLKIASVSTPNPSFVKTKHKINWSCCYWWDELFIENKKYHGEKDKKMSHSIFKWSSKSKPPKNFLVWLYFPLFLLFDNFMKYVPSSIFRNDIYFYIYKKCYLSYWKGHHTLIDNEINNMNQSKLQLWQGRG